jgi:peptide/nickel transport system permease protein
MVAAAYMLFLLLFTIFVPWLSPYSAEQIDLRVTLALPSVEHPLGTDESGRDVLTRLFAGARGSLTVGVVAMVLSVVIGAIIGGSAGYFGGTTDGVLMLITDAFLSIPLFFVLLTILVLFGPTLPNIVVVIGLTSWMGVARIVRSEMLRYRGLEFVEAARVLGASNLRILLNHLLIQAVPSIAVAATFGMASAILVETALSYLGLGIQPPNPSWGNMLTNAQSYLNTAPDLAVYPGLLILLTVLSLNFLGDILRDVLDPFSRMR